MKHSTIARKIAATAVLLAVVVGATMLAARHTPRAQPQDGRVAVVTSYYPLYDFVRQVGGDRVSATNMTPPGMEPHDFEPSAKALADASRAPVFVYNGTPMEPWAVGFVKGYHGVAVKASDGIPLLQGVDESEPAVQAPDPHFWLDPVLAQHIVDTVAAGLRQADPANAAYYMHNAAAYKQQLAVLDTAYRTGLAHCQLRQVIASHDAFAYLGKRYNIAVAPITGLSPDAEPSAARLADLSRLVQEDGIHYIFFERLASSRLADTIATETGAKTLVFDPIEGLSEASQKQGKDYLSVQRENLQNLRTALACR